MSDFYEPWTAIHLDDRDAEIYGTGNKPGIVCEIPVAERVAACVNFCRGIPTEQLEKSWIGECGCWKVPGFNIPL